jgi:hypothetical protein
METIYVTVNLVFIKLLYDVRQGQGLAFNNGQHGELLLSFLLFLLLVLFMHFLPF